MNISTGADFRARAPLILSWPPSVLWPNSRVDRRAATGARQKAKEEAWALCLKAGLRDIDTDTLHVSLTFHPPSKVRRDLDNMLGAMKSALDGIALATGVDDSKWSISLQRGAVMKPGIVRVRLSTAPDSVRVPVMGVIS